MPNKFFAATLAALLLAPAASASVARWKSFDEKVSEADAILRGRAVSSQSRFDDSGKWIITETTFTVDETLKGGPASTVTIVTPGGRVDGLNQRTVGIPEFSPGDERILFTAKRDGLNTILYQEQGTYEVVRDGSRSVVVPASSDLILVDPQKGTAAMAETPRSIEDFRADVTRAMGPGRVGRIQKSEVAPARHEVPWLPLVLVAIAVIAGVLVLMRKLR